MSRLKNIFEELCESPIEIQFAVAFSHCWQNNIGAAPHVRPANKGEKRLKRGLTIIPQYWLKPYRVDFFIAVKGENLMKFICVECDGHEFHERTKAAAARDRQKDRDFIYGRVPLLRFTGSEIYRDPDSCAEETYDHIAKLLREAIK